MSDAKFTPGPWMLRDVGSYYHIRSGHYEVCSGQKTICSIGWRRPVSDEEKYDGNLISASPEMYSALNQCVHYLKCAGHDRITADEIIAEAEAALKKARGEQ